MSKRNLLVTSLLVGLFAITGCSEQTEGAAENTSEGVSQVADKAATVTEGALEKAGDTVAQAGESAVDSTVTAGEAIAEGGQELTTSPEGVVDEDQQY